MLACSLNASKDCLANPSSWKIEAGGATMIAAEAVARSAKDGHTLLFAGSNTLSIVPHVYRKVS